MAQMVISTMSRSSGHIRRTDEKGSYIRGTRPRSLVPLAASTSKVSGAESGQGVLEADCLFGRFYKRT